MSVRVRLDSGSVEQTSSGAIVGRIWIEMGDRGFPEAGWFDFPVTILIWWIGALRSLISRSSDEVLILFMDGPFEIRLERVGQTTVAVLHRSGLPTMSEVEMEPEELLASALECADTLLTDLRSLGMESAELDDLGRVVAGSG